MLGLTRRPGSSVSHVAVQRYTEVGAATHRVWLYLLMMEGASKDNVCWHKILKWLCWQGRGEPEVKDGVWARHAWLLCVLLPQVGERNNDAGVIK